MCVCGGGGQIDRSKEGERKKNRKNGQKQGRRKKEISRWRKEKRFDRSKGGGGGKTEIRDRC